MADASSYNQTQRLLTLKTALGDDALMAVDMTGIEEVSRLFSFDITVLSHEATIPRADILGTDATLGIGFKTADGTQSYRPVNGIVTSIADGAFRRDGQRFFHLRLAPKLWLLDRTTNSAVYNQLMQVKDVIDKVLGRNGLTCEYQLQNTYADKEFRVQYNETDLAFISRIAADEGIYFYFTHTADEHTLVFADAAQYPDCELASAQYRQGDGTSADVVSGIRYAQVLSDTAWKHVHYDFKAPDQPPTAETKSTIEKAATVTGNYVFGEGQPLQADLTNRSKKRIEEAEAASGILDGAGTCATFVPGHKFTLKIAEPHLSKEESFVLRSVRHEASQPSGLNDAAGEQAFYRNDFSAIPADRVVRDPLPRAKPVMHGAHTATVVGPSGNEVYTDAHGRVRVQFPWDQEGTHDEKSSCFIRVSQSWAGKQWGTMFIPRVGMEVIVDFTGGDPDQPLITGMVYNGVNVPPFELPAEKTKSGLRTRSMENGTAQTFNELSFDDKKDSEKVFFKAQKDFERKVLNDDTLDVGHDQTRTIKNDRTTTITEGNEVFKIETGNRTETITKGDETLTISAGARTVKLDQGNDSLELGTGNLVVKLTSGDLTTTLSSGSLTTKCTAGKITMEAAQGITLKCGSNKIEITPQGIAIEGMMVAIKGTTKTDVEGLLVNVKASGMLQINGALVKIN